MAGEWASPGKWRPREESNRQTALPDQHIDLQGTSVAILHHVRQTVRRLYPSRDPKSDFPARRQSNRRPANPSETTHFSGAGTPGRPPSRKALAGAGGFEPPHGGIKIRCLTTWRRPKNRSGRRRDGARRAFLWQRRSIEGVEPFQPPIRRISARTRAGLLCPVYGGIRQVNRVNFGPNGAAAPFATHPVSPRMS